MYGGGVSQPRNVSYEGMVFGLRLSGWGFRSIGFWVLNQGY